MTKYRKLPVVVEAIQYKGDMNPVWDLFGAEKVFGETEDTFPYIETLEGKMRISVDDYIIKGVNGEFYPCKPDIFDKTYETVADEAETEEIYFAKAARPAIEFMNTLHPHHTMVITADSAELLESQRLFKTTEYLRD